MRRLSFSRLASALESVRVAEPVIAPVHATGTETGRFVLNVARVTPVDDTVPSRNEAGVSIIGGRIVEVGGDGQRRRSGRSRHATDLERVRLAFLDVAGRVDRAELDRVLARRPRP